MSISSSTVGGGRVKYKIIFLGDQSVGKSSILEKYIKDKFEQALNPTVGIDFHIKNVSRNGKQYRIQLWDTAGQQRFRSLIPSYMKDANCAVMVYDVTKPQSLSNLKTWNSLFEEHQPPGAIKVFVGNKIDLTAQRQIAKKDGEQEAAKFNSKHLEVSAKSGKKLDELFNSIVDLIAVQVDTSNKLPVIEDEERPEKQHEMKKMNSVKFPIMNDPIGTTNINQRKQKTSCCE